MELSFDFWITILFIVLVMGAIQGTCAYLILVERKIAAYVQDRLGPNRVGPRGLLQPIADGLKFLFKEEVIPRHVDRVLYILAPMIAVITALLAFSVVPFGRTTPPPQLVDYRTDPPRAVWPQTVLEEEELLRQDEEHARALGHPTYREKLEEYNNTTQFVIAPHVDIGLLFVFAIGSLAVYAVVLGGWSSNNKYSMLGSLRSSAQLISYEIPLGMSVLGVFYLTGSLNLERIVDYQAEHGWNILFQPLAALLFIVAVFAETNRLPFDLPEAEQELVGGYHTEYSAMKFALFFLGEYTHMITTSFLVVIVFFGGWHLPWIAEAGQGGVILKLIILAGKMSLFIVFYMLVRWTIPRFRFDQLMGLAWRVMMPLALTSFVCVILVDYFELSHWWLLPLSLAILIGSAALTTRLPRPATRAPLRVWGPGTPDPLGVSRV
jgi:NADH-quinone oxidoreductase subunit H